jgi:CubicO group peptidase (beta-lactamase class C family)
VLVAKGGKVLLNKGYGYRNVEDSVPNTAESIFQLGSITKQFTAAVILKLQEEKKLSIADKLNKYFPTYPKGDSITIKQLLTHTSGISNYTNDAAFMAKEVTKPHNREQMIALFKDKPLDFSPGTGWNYSNSGYSLLGYIIEAATGTSYDAAVRKYIFTPLHMTHSGFDFAHLKHANKTTGYLVVDGKNAPLAPIVDSSVSYAAGAIYSTTADLYLWHQALQQNKVLSKLQQEEAFTPVKNRYGFGWVIDSISGKRRVGHNGGIPGFITNESRVPEDDIDIVLLSNATDNSLEKITQGIYAILYGTPYELPKQKVAIQLPAETLQQYIGEYEITPNLHVVMSVKDGQLNALPTGQPEKTIYADKEDSFFQKEQDIRLEFTRDANKQVDGFNLYQNGRQIKCKRIK